MLASGLGSRASLGYPGDKYEMGLEAIERIEVIAAELAAEVFDAKYAEVRVASGALANLYAFMATCKPGDTIIAPPAEHRRPRHAPCGGLRGPVRPEHRARRRSMPTATPSTWRRCARWRSEVRPQLITIGGSLNLFPHPVGAMREVADEVGAQAAVRRRAPVGHDRRPRLAATRWTRARI